MRFRFSDFAGIVAQLIESSPNRFGARQGFIAVTVLANQLTTDFGGTEAGIQTSRGELWVGLALTVHNRLNVEQQVGQTVFVIAQLGVVDKQ